jgi:hypothetical protein
MKQLIAWFWHMQTYKTNKPLGFEFLFGTYGLTHEAESYGIIKK